MLIILSLLLLLQQQKQTKVQCFITNYNNYYNNNKKNVISSSPSSSFYHWKVRRNNYNKITSSTVQLNNNNNNEEITKRLYPNLYIIGICGSIGSGKSYTSSLLVSKLNEMLQHSLNNNDDDDDDDDNNNNVDDDDNESKNTFAFHIDTDSLAHGVYKPGSLALKEIEYEFGKEVIQEDGTVDRKVLGGIVFSDENQMAVRIL